MLYKIAYNTYLTYNTYHKNSHSSEWLFCYKSITINLRISHRAHIQNRILGRHRAVNINLCDVALVARDILLQ